MSLDHDLTLYAKIHRVEFATFLDLSKNIHLRFYLFFIYRRRSFSYPLRYRLFPNVEEHAQLVFDIATREQIVALSNLSISQFMIFLL